MPSPGSILAATRISSAVRPQGASQRRGAQGEFIVVANPGGTNLAAAAPQSRIVTSGVTALHLAAAAGSPAAVKALLAAGANPNRFDTVGHSPLHYAAALAQSEVVRVLLDAGVSPKLVPSGPLPDSPLNLYRPEGDTALHLAARAASTNVVAQLLDAGAEVNATNRLGQTPLFLASNPPPGPIIHGGGFGFIPRVPPRHPTYERTPDRTAVIDLLVKHGGREAGYSRFTAPPPIPYPTLRLPPQTPPRPGVPASKQP
jgi:hypothetical protein